MNNSVLDFDPEYQTWLAERELETILHMEANHPAFDTCVAIYRTTGYISEPIDLHAPDAIERALAVIRAGWGRR